MPITEEHIKHYREHGYAIVENFLEPDELARARDEIEEYVPGWLDYAATRTETGLRVGIRHPVRGEIFASHSRGRNLMPSPCILK